MRFAGTATLPQSPATVRAALHDVAGWGQWAPGLASLAVLVESEDRAEVAAEVAGPPRTRVRIDVQKRDDGLAFGLIEGDVSMLSGMVHATEHAEGTTLAWAVEVRLLVVLPGTLQAELAQEVLPRWVHALGGVLDAA